MKKIKKVTVGLSGGVDSAVAAYLLKKKGWDVTGFTLKLCSSRASCREEESFERAESLCRRLGIPHHIIDAGEEFEKNVVSYFTESYLLGLTPNPCAYCNRFIKLGFLLNKVKSLGFSYLATGHYTRAIKRKGYFLFRRGKDKKKSQEYFLSLVEPSAAGSLIFPLGGYTKDKVKRIASDNKLDFVERKESQDACFTEGESYINFIEKNSPDCFKYAGDIKHISGKILGKHKGIYRYTLGQRAGLGIAWPKPLYVIAIEAKTNTVIAGEREFLSRDCFSVVSLNWFAPPREFKNIKVKIRYNSKFYNCSLDIKENRAQVKLKEKAEAIAPGQIAVFYWKDLLLGGGIISR